MGFPVVDEEKCTGEGDCVDICPADPVVFEIEDEKSHVVHPDACIECGLCVDECPEEAIVLNED
ncbi:MAG: indolepyruvate ferredoxin oxidoreductase subunit alpha [Chitinophagales bacterium]